MKINPKNIIKAILISLLMTYLTVFVEYKMPPTPPYTAEFMPDEVLVGGLPFYFIEDHQGISPVNSLQSNPIDLLLSQIDVFYWDKFLINWWFWLSLVLLVLFLKNMLKRSQLNH